ncbi:hypothetical protein F5883DRAFT_571630 [Diaporthe sp. PMI_573]|nr:hypothetical protein F5883DRAFT_571630 [Diaporthaceae sp. PMI_573]
MDTDSEPEISPPSVPAAEAPTPAAPQISAISAPATAAPPVTSSTPGSIQAVIVRCDVERIRFAPWSVTKDIDTVKGASIYPPSWFAIQSSEMLCSWLP